MFSGHRVAKLYHKYGKLLKGLSIVTNPGCVGSSAAKHLRVHQLLFKFESLICLCSPQGIRVAVGINQKSGKYLVGRSYICMYINNDTKNY